MALRLQPNDDWQPVSVTKPETIKRPGAPKVQPELNEDSEIAFITQCFRWQDTALPGVWVQVLLQVIFVFAASACAKYLISYSNYDNAGKELVRMFALPADVSSGQAAISLFVSVLVTYYSGNAYSNFVEGRKILGGLCNNCREMCQNAFCAPLRDGADMQKVEYLRKLLRRKLNVLLVFMRQHAREGEGDNGFQPGSEMEAEAFVAQGDAMNWHMDPVVPSISNLVNEAEVAMYSAKGTGMRPAMVQAELNVIAGELSKELRYPGDFMDLWLQNSEDTMNLFKSMFRIISTPIPMPYKHMLYVVVFLYIYLIPWIHANASISSGWVDIGSTTYDDITNVKYGLSKNDGQGFTQGWIASVFSCLVFYGLLELSVALFNPFGHDAIDHDIGSFNGKANAEMLVIAKMTKASKSADMTDYTKVPHPAV